MASNTADGPALIIRMYNPKKQAIDTTPAVRNDAADDQEASHLSKQQMAVAREERARRRDAQRANDTVPHVQDHTRVSPSSSSSASPSKGRQRANAPSRARQPEVRSSFDGSTYATLSQAVNIDTQGLVSTLHLVSQLLPPELRQMSIGEAMYILQEHHVVSGLATMPNDVRGNGKHSTAVENPCIGEHRKAPRYVNPSELDLGAEFDQHLNFLHPPVSLSDTARGRPLIMFPQPVALDFEDESLKEDSEMMTIDDLVEWDWDEEFSKVA